MSTEHKLIPMQIVLRLPDVPHSDGLVRAPRDHQLRLRDVPAVSGSDGDTRDAGGVA